MAVQRAGLGNEELVLIGVREGSLQWHAVGHRILDFLFESVGEAFKEEDREDVVLVVRRVDLTAQNIGGSPKPGLQFLPGEGDWLFSSVGIGWGTGLAFDALLSASRGARHAAAGRLQPPKCMPPRMLPRAGLSCRDRAMTARGPRPRRGFWRKAT